MVAIEVEKTKVFYLVVCSLTGDSPREEEASVNCM